MQFERNIIHRPKISKLYDDAPSLGHVIIKNLMNAGEKTMIVCGLTGQKWSANEIVNKSIEIAKALIAAGIRQGDIVSIVSENRLESAFVLLGTIFINCTVAPLNHTYTHAELLHALNFSKPKFIFTGGSATQGAVEIGKTLSYVKKIICFDDCDSPEKNLTVSFSDFTNRTILQNVNFEPKAVDTSKSNCLIMCSSGTTGLPKGVQLSQSGIIETACHIKEFVFTKANVGDEEAVILGLLPLFHVFGALVLISTMANISGKMIMLPKFEGESFLRCIEKYRCSVAFLVPPLLVFLAKHDLVDKYDLSSLRFILSGAAPISKELEQSVKDRLKTNLMIKQVYGMTELTSSVLMQKDIVKPGSVGDVNASVYAKIVDENGNALGPHRTGELCFKSKSLIMMGYISNAQATNAIIDNEGWLHTGDIGYYDDDFQFFIVDRIKELIKWKGYQVPPAEIEGLLLTHPKIKDCGVIGKQDELAGEVALAFIVKEDTNLTEDEIIKYIYDKVSPAKRLHGGVIFIDEIPKNPSGKILRRELRDLLHQKDLKSKL